MNERNSVFIATSLDGYIADKNGGIEWLNSVPNPDNNDFGYGEFIARIDALIMGRITFETVCGFDIEWPYQKPVFVLSNSLTKIPEKYRYKAHLTRGKIPEVLEEIHTKGYHHLCIDGGKTIQSFLKEDLIDEMVITVIPTLLGAGTPLFSELPRKLDFECTGTNLFLNKVVQNQFIRKD